MLTCSWQDVAAFLLSPEARDLRPLLLREIIDGLDLLARDQLRRAYSRCSSCSVLLRICYHDLDQWLEDLIMPEMGEVSVDEARLRLHQAEGRWQAPAPAQRQPFDSRMSWDKQC